MPRYQFFCEACGPFEQWRDHRESGEPMFCPSCGISAKRVYSTPKTNVPSRTGNRLRPQDEPGPGAGVVERPPPLEPSTPTGPRRAGGRPWQISH